MDGESISEWIGRSKLPRAREVRRFVNVIIVEMPPESREGFMHSLRQEGRWESAIFELIVVRMMQQMGARVEIESPDSAGRRPDILAHFPDGEVVVEATCPTYNVQMAAELKIKQPLVTFIA